MTKAASIFLRADIMPEDVKSLVRWMENPAVTRYLNEEPDVTCSLRRILQTVPAPILTFQFNRQGRFFMACCPGGDTIGFVKLREMAEQGTYEIVYAIGEETLWGNGYGEGTIRSALFTAFLEWRARKIVAKICPGNQRSVRAVQSCGFRREETDGQLLQYSITMDDYLRKQLGT